jgi:hypothetical protein
LLPIRIRQGFVPMVEFSSSFTQKSMRSKDSRFETSKTRATAWLPA